MAETKEQRSANRKRHYAENRERYRQWNKDWTARHAEKRRKDKAAWARKKIASDPKQAREQRDRFQRANRNKVVIYTRRWQKKNPHKKTNYDHARRARIKSASTLESCAEKIALIKRTTKFCRWCCVPVTLKTVTIDHVVPLARGGKHEPDNLTGCCKPCNSSKGDRLVGEWLPSLKAA